MQFFRSIVLGVGQTVTMKPLPLVGDGKVELVNFGCDNSVYDNYKANHTLYGKGFQFFFYEFSTFATSSSLFLKSNPPSRIDFRLAR